MMRRLLDRGKSFVQVLYVVALIVVIVVGVIWIKGHL